MTRKKTEDRELVDNITGKVKTYVTKSFSLYIHIPYCAHKCPYCDFNTYAVPKPPEEEYTTALIQELVLAKNSGNWDGKKLHTIFFGGGTPSFFSALKIAEIINKAKELFGGDEIMEISLEANPEHITSEYSTALLAGGVTRVSLGVQSLTDKNLVRLGRNHTANSAERAVRTLADAGFKNISLDLMYGTPGQALEELISDIETAATLPINHISIYGLTIEAGTPFYVSHKKGDLKIPDEDLNATMYERMLEKLSTLGFRRYEVSNFAKDDTAQSLHNINYWQHGEYLGIGAGAHSFLRTSKEPCGVHWSNEAKPQAYMDHVALSGTAVAWRESLSSRQALGETFFVGLRMLQGVPFKRGETSSNGLEPRSIYASLFATLAKNGLIVDIGDQVRLTDKGLQFLDTILQDLFE